MNIRLVAYRKATTASTSDTTYQLDLQEAPNVALNFQFSDVKEPETRKGSYSQTFKLPFTQNNNQFFENWYNVNLDTLVFSTKTKFDAVLYVGTVPQFEGALQLKAVYQKAQQYEVVMISNSASLFNIIGNRRLRDVFKNDDGSYSEELNHVYTYTNETNNTLYKSWDGNNSNFLNTAGVSMRDLDANVQKVVYPMSVTAQGFYFDPNEDRYLNMDQTAATDIINETGSVQAASEFGVSFTQFRPAIQIRTLFKKILGQAGFSYTSSFIDDSYFGKIFMTTANYLESAVTPTVNAAANPSGVMSVGSNVAWADWQDEIILPCSPSGCSCDTVNYTTLSTVTVPANITEPSGNCTDFGDENNIWNTANSYFTRTASTQETITISHNYLFVNVVGSYNGIHINYSLVGWDATNNQEDGEEYEGVVEYIPIDITSGITPHSGTLNITLDITQIPLNSSAQIQIHLGPIRSISDGFIQCPLTQCSLTPTNQSSSEPIYLEGDCSVWSKVQMNWFGFSDDIFDATVDIPACIDPELTQRGFLKDIIQRFNLVVLADPDNASNLLIEPYNDFIGSGELKNWTDKLDTSKEVVVKDTTELQKKVVHLTDQEDVDLYNKSIKERYPNVNVFGHVKIDEFNNEFASGELKNESMFSPYINGQVFRSEDEQAGTSLPNMAIQYEFTYKQNSEGIYENEIAQTKPKLFWYRGTPVDILGPSASQTDIYLHRATASSLTAFNINEYPICSPFDIQPAGNTYTLGPGNKSLYWNGTPPLVGNLTVFNYQPTFGSWFNNTLYGKYWKPYLDNLYSEGSRIMECYLNLNEVDIFNFSFADEIFIKDTYWRILGISNYQVGAKASTKVTLIKSLDTRSTCSGCNYVIGTIGTSNTTNFGQFIWCPEDDPDCTPDITGSYWAGVYTTPECCTCNGGYLNINDEDPNNAGMYSCLSLSGSLPMSIKSLTAKTSILDNDQTKSLLTGLLGGTNRPLVRGSDSNKFGQKILNYYGDDIVIKYKSTATYRPQYRGESHRIVLTGYTDGNTRGYAYPKGNPYEKPLFIPDNTNVIIRVKGVCTVVGGTSATYPLGTTDAVAYYTAFIINQGVVTQLGATGGEAEFQIREGVNPVTCTLHIDIDSNVIRFGLDDSQTDTKRAWMLTADMDINVMKNLALGFDENWALFQNGKKIQFENHDYLIWN
jgi:hypothetical protein